MAVSTVGSVVTHGSTANSGNQNITVPSGAKLAVIFWCGAPSSGNWSMSSISLGGVAGVIRSNVAAVFGTNAAIGSATVENPPAGTQALSWDYTGSATAAVGSAFIVRFFTADGNIVVADWDAAAGGQGSTVQSLTVDSASDGYVVGMAAGALDANGAPTGSGQTLDLNNFSTNNLFADLSHVDSPGASTTTWNMTASEFASGAVVSLMEEPPPPPEPPTGLDVTPASSSELSVTWDTEEGDLSYDVRFRRTDEFPSLTVQSSAPWHLERLSQRTRSETNQYLYGYTGAGVRIYVFDTGVRATHNQFGGRVIAGFNATNGPSSDELGHGTQVASSAAGSTSGTAKGATIVPVKVARTGTAEEVSVDPDYATDYFEGLAWIANNHPSDVRGVVTSSVPLPVGADEEELEQAWQALLDKGLVCVQAAPNDGQQGFPGYPAGPPLPEGIIFVGGMREVDEFRPESNYGSFIDIIAPADSLTGLAGHTSDNATINSAGNSNAAPMVAGICAMILEENPHASVQRVTEILTQQATIGVLTSMPPNTVNALAYSLASSTDWVTHTDVGSPPYVIDSLEPDTEYEVQVRRTTADGTSDWSSSVLGTTALLPSGQDLIRVVDESIQIAVDQVRALQLNRIREETVQLSEAVIRAIALARAAIESVEIGESLVQVLGKVRIHNETVQLSETLLSVLGRVRVHNETVQVSEILLSALSRVRVHNETIQLSESISKALQLVRSIDENVSVSETLAKLMALTRILSEDVSAIEALTRSLALIRTRNETVDITETLVRILEASLIRVINESVQITEGALNIISTAIIKVVSEIVQLSESANVVHVLVRVVQETIQASESLTTSRILTRLQLETVQLGEQAAVARAMTRLIQEVVQTQEELIFARTLVKVVSESLNISEDVINIDVIAGFLVATLRIVAALDSDGIKIEPTL